VRKLPSSLFEQKSDEADLLPTRGDIDLTVRMKEDLDVRTHPFDSFQVPCHPKPLSWQVGLCKAALGMKNRVDSVGSNCDGSMEDLVPIREIHRMASNPLDCLTLLKNLGHLEALPHSHIGESLRSLKKKVIQIVTAHDDPEGDAVHSRGKIGLSPDPFKATKPHATDLDSSLGKNLWEKSKCLQDGNPLRHDPLTARLVPGKDCPIEEQDVITLRREGNRAGGSRNAGSDYDDIRV